MYYATRFLALALFIGLISFSSEKKKDLKLIYKDRKYGLQDADGNVVVEPVYNNVIWKEKDLICFQLNDKWGLFNNEGKMITEIKYNSIGPVSETTGFMVAKAGNYFGYLDKFGKERSEFKFEEAENFNTDFAPVKMNGKWGVINTGCQFVIPADYEDIKKSTNYLFAVKSHVRDSIVAVKKNGRWGYVSLKNELLIPFNYTDASECSEGIVWVKNSTGKWGAVDYENKTVLPFEFDNFSPEKNLFFHQTAIVSRHNMYGVIDKNGKMLVPDTFDQVKRIDVSNYYVTQAAKRQYGYINLKGKCKMYPQNVTLPPFDKITKAPSQLPDYVTFFGDYNSTGCVPDWTLEHVVSVMITNFRNGGLGNSTSNYFKFDCARDGLSLFGGYSGQNGKETFKQKIAYKIIGSEMLRNIAWKWAMPQFRNEFKNMNPYQQKVYKELARYLKNHMDHYNRQAIEKFLANEKDRFAYSEPNGEYNPYRPSAAFIDRLILIHKVIGEKDARTWVDKIANEVEKW
jgi:hypothetical protein